MTNRIHSHNECEEFSVCPQHRTPAPSESTCEACGRALPEGASWCDSNCFDLGFNRRHYGSPPPDAVVIVWNVYDTFEQADLVVFFLKSDALEFARAAQPEGAPRYQVERSIKVGNRCV